VIRSHIPGPGRPRRWRRARALAALAVPLALAAGVIPASGTAAAQPTAPTEPADQHQTLSLPRLHDNSYSLTLLTGDQIRLTDAGGGHYSVTASSSAGQGTVTVNATSGPDGVKTLQAMPSAAQFLIASGQLDQSLFDIQYLTTHGYADNANKAIPVTIQYTDHPDAATLNHRADSLPASTVAATNANTATADLRVDPTHAADLWTALTHTGTTTAPGMPPSQLATGIAHAWLTGHHTSDQPTVRPDAGQPAYPVTLTIKLEVGALGNQAMYCNLELTTICGAGASIVAVDGDDAGQGASADWVCVDHDPCTTMRASFDVPAGSYFLDSVGWVSFWIDGHDQEAWIVEPQVDVNGPTDVTLDLSRLQHFTINTPKPTETFNGMVQWQRDLPDGAHITTFTLGAAYGLHSDWALPTDQPVTIGGFHFATAWLLGKPPVTARVDSPEHFDLHPMYPFYSARGGYVVRFSGQQRLQVVDAGSGAPEDFAAIDARGKLVFMRTDPWCEMSKAQLDNAIQAGAAGVLIDPRTPLDQPCVLPTRYEQPEPPPEMPFAAIAPSEATRLEDLLRHGDAQMTITDSGPSSYTYNLKFYEEGGIPASLRYDVDDDQLTAVDSRFHADAATAYQDQIWAAWRPNEYLIGGVVDERVAWPAKRTEYYGPASPDLVYYRSWALSTGGLSPLTRVEVFDQRGGRRTEDLGARPDSLGPFGYDPRVPAAQPSERFAQECAMCRQGNAFGPIADFGQGSRPMSDARALDPDATHLYLGDEEIPQTESSSFYPAYMLPPEQHTYRLVTDYDNQDFGHTHVDWTFSSAAPDHNQTPPGRYCYGTPDAPCRADPLVFLTYDLGVALDNTLAAGPGGYRFTVTANHQATDTPAIQDLKVWTSTDEGKTWTPARVQPSDRGANGARTFSVMTNLPQLDQTTGTLSIKAQATDADGNSIDQTITQAIKLNQRSGHGGPAAY
jgi:hypothetical protein